MNQTFHGAASDIRAWNENLPGNVHLEFVRTPDERSALLQDFLAGLTGLASKVQVSESEGEAGQMPSIRPGDSWTFHMVPEGQELAPFLNLLAAAAGGISRGLSGEVAEKLSEINEPSLIDIFVSNLCPACPAVVDRLCRFPLINPLIHVRVTDGVLFHERASENSVLALPTVLIAGGQRFTGQARPEDVADGLIHRDPSKMSADVFARMIRAGDAESLAKMMIKSGKVFPGVLELLAADNFPLRLGAMVAIEEVGRIAPRLALEALDQVWERMENAALSARGDMAYLIGLFGDNTWILRLEGLLAPESSPDFREIVEEALSTLREKVSRELIERLK